jgi:hypothetical protein
MVRDHSRHSNDLVGTLDGTTATGKSSGCRLLSRYATATLSPGRRSKPACCAGAARGERVNEVDWEHVIEEIKDVGLSQLHSDQSYLHQMMVHLLKVHDWPDSLSAGHWRGEFVACQEDAARRFAPPMRQRIDLTRHTATQSNNWRSPVTKRARLALGPRSARSPWTSLSVTQVPRSNSNSRRHPSTAQPS